MSGRLLFERVRKGLAALDQVVVASAVPPAVEGRPDDYRLAPSKVIEGSVLAVRTVGSATICPDPVAFLDGCQRYEVVGYLGTAPLVAAVVTAAVRYRVGGRLETVEVAERRIMVARRGALTSGLSTSAAGFELVTVDAEEEVHPLKALEEARRAIDTARAALERLVGARFRARYPSPWLIVDGVISDAEGWATDPFAIGVSKSHATLPFDGPSLERYLTLPQGHRTSVFEPATWRFTPVHSWALRLWPFEGRDLLHGLVRVEVAARADSIAKADEISRWLLAERAPLSRPDPRWDRLLYGVATVERHLRAK